jgi:hypothetical protein
MFYEIMNQRLSNKHKKTTDDNDATLLITKK